MKTTFGWFNKCKNGSKRDGRQKTDWTLPKRRQRGPKMGIYESIKDEQMQTHVLILPIEGLNFMDARGGGSNKVIKQHFTDFFMDTRSCILTLLVGNTSQRGISYSFSSILLYYQCTDILFRTTHIFCDGNFAQFALKHFINRFSGKRNN